MRRILVVVVTLALALGGCGDDDETTSQGGSPPTTAAEEATGRGMEGQSDTPPVALAGQVNDQGRGQLFGEALDLEAGDFYFEPTFIQASQGQAATITVRNQGQAPHTFTVESLQIDVEVGPGQSREVQVQLPERGSVEFICRFHAEQGMRGAFYFQAS